MGTQYTSQRLYTLCLGCGLSLLEMNDTIEKNIKEDNLVNKTNWVHNFFLVYLSTSTCFVRLCAHHQEIQLCLCDNW